ncbi:hypothetical protein Amet_0885 [Alkaliphilus metalliredigens QYMF]|uniref:Uncharacterized protein n=1 Tax=Alkaliphilus metalliredigens (strain QYMF) TaxID=293826 RepID=A6TLN9_ALKMQ|nr:hypothetical protein Amet_0885 [Alkaliphilus metalliredigens QYMF]
MNFGADNGNWTNILKKSTKNIKENHFVTGKIKGG